MAETTHRARAAELRPVMDRLAAALGVSRRVVWPLVWAGIRDVEDMAGWTLSDLLDVQSVGAARRRVLIVALREAGVPLPDDRLDTAGRAQARQRVAEGVSRG